MNIEVVPLIAEGEDQLLMIVFNVHQMEFPEQSGNAGNKDSVAKARRIKKLEDELAAARSVMSSITHDQEIAFEELQSANEEIVSSNEELQSLNEELKHQKKKLNQPTKSLLQM